MYAIESVRIISRTPRTMLKKIHVKFGGPSKLAALYAAHILHKAGSALVFLYAPSLLFPALWKHSSTRAIFVDIIHHLH